MGTAVALSRVFTASRNFSPSEPLSWANAGIAGQATINARPVIIHRRILLPFQKLILDIAALPPQGLGRHE
jgi:hypothetical protein